MKCPTRHKSALTEDRLLHTPGLQISKNKKKPASCACQQKICVCVSREGSRRVFRPFVRRTSPDCLREEKTTLQILGSARDDRYVTMFPPAVTSSVVAMISLVMDFDFMARFRGLFYFKTRAHRLNVSSVSVLDTVLAGDHDNSRIQINNLPVNIC